MGQKVWVAVYDHRHGEDVRAFDSEAKAEAWRQEIADEWWDSEIPTERPDSREEMADQYFDEMCLRTSGDHENFTINHVEIE